MAVIRYLQQARRPFLMPAVCHGRKADHPKGPSGSNVFKQEKKSGWFTPHPQGGKKDKATVWLCVKRARWMDRHGRKKTDTWVYAYWGITPRRVDWVEETYRKRFGIETSYRQMNQCRIRTTSQKFNVRFLYVAIGLVVEEPVGLDALLRPVEPASRRSDSSTGISCAWNGCCSGWSEWPKRCMDWPTQ